MRTILSYHIVPGVAATSSALTNGQTLPTRNNGQTLTVDLSSPGTVRIQPSGGPAATVITPDVTACNAIIHTIDTVLLPSNISPSTATPPTTPAPAAATAAASANAGATTGSTTGAGTDTTADADSDSTGGAGTDLTDDSSSDGGAGGFYGHK